MGRLYASLGTEGKWRRGGKHADTCDAVWNPSPKDEAHRLGHGGLERRAISAALRAEIAIDSPLEAPH
ncbi:MAG: hypothetical protein ICV69_03525 [Thermoleophilaceae bacterium]|nr:hypothetical protein [Thermoleophilaceae bacterium]